MKKFSYLFLSLFAAMSLVLTSCGDDEEEPVVKTPSISLAAESNKDGDKVDGGAALKIIFSASKGENDLKSIMIDSKNASGDAQVVTISSITGFDDKSAIVATNQNTITLDGDDKNDGVINGNINFMAPSTTGSYTYTITVTDSKDVTATNVFTITVGTNAVVKTVTEISSNVVMGAQSASEAGYYSVGNAKLNSSNDVKADNSTINFSFAQTGTTTLTSKLISLSARSGEKLTVNTTGGIDTYFATSSLNYDNVTATEIEAISASTDTKITIEQGKTYQFVDKNGIKGLIKVVKITENTTTEGGVTKIKGTATISVKVVK